MLLEKTRSVRPRLRSKGLSLEIRCKANRLPLKSMLYAISHARAKLSKPKTNANLYVHKLASHTRDLGFKIDSLNGSVDPNPDDNSDSIKSAVGLYVDLFYTISKEERKRYMEEFNEQKNRKITNERNLLIIPALMAELNMPKEEISDGLFHQLYRMPFKVLHDSSKSALHIGILEQNMAIKSVPYETVEKFSASMSRLEQRIKQIEQGRINPQDDEDLKADFIEKAADFSKKTEINIIDLISERVGTQSAVLTRMHRLIRRARY
jgi:hypothetical protein